jgi:hypothetical protein
MVGGDHTSGKAWFVRRIDMLVDNPVLDHALEMITKLMNHGSISEYVRIVSKV